MRTFVSFFLRTKAAPFGAPVGFFRVADEGVEEEDLFIVSLRGMQRNGTTVSGVVMVMEGNRKEVDDDRLTLI